MFYRWKKAYGDMPCETGRVVITKADMIPVMLEACPSFEPKWREFLDYWHNEPDPPLYLALADLARHLIDALSRMDTATFPLVFAVIERWHREGDPFVAEAATVGLLEDLQNTNLHTTTEPEEFRRWLLPESAKCWDKLYGFWDRGELLE